uniref:Uncharacterized protein n=1 Tax=Meloidogyne javanica TaxID=6303 RepID=A0A915NBD9_MELJA
MLMLESANAESCQECFNKICTTPCLSNCDACQMCHDIDFRPQCRGPCDGFSGPLGPPADCQAGKVTIAESLQYLCKHRPLV